MYSERFIWQNLECIPALWLVGAGGEVCAEGVVVGRDKAEGDLFDYITLNVPPGAFSNVPLQRWSLSVRQS